MVCNSWTLISLFPLYLTFIWLTLSILRSLDMSVWLNERFLLGCAFSIETHFWETVVQPLLFCFWLEELFVNYLLIEFEHRGSWWIMENAFCVWILRILINLLIFTSYVIQIASFTFVSRTHFLLKDISSLRRRALPRYFCIGFIAAWWHFSCRAQRLNYAGIIILCEAFMIFALNLTALEKLIIFLIIIFIATFKFKLAFEWRNALWVPIQK